MYSYLKKIAIDAIGDAGLITRPIVHKAVTLEIPSKDSNPPHIGGSGVSQQNNNCMEYKKENGSQTKIAFSEERGEIIDTVEDSKELSVTNSIKTKIEESGTQGKIPEKIMKKEFTGEEWAHNNASDINKINQADVLHQNQNFEKDNKNSDFNAVIPAHSHINSTMDSMNPLNSIIQEPTDNLLSCNKHKKTNTQNKKDKSNTMQPDILSVQTGQKVNHDATPKMIKQTKKNRLSETQIKNEMKEEQIILTGEPHKSGRIIKKNYLVTQNPEVTTAHTFHNHAMNDNPIHAQNYNSKQNTGVHSTAIKNNKGQFEELTKEKVHIGHIDIIINAPPGEVKNNTSKPGNKPAHPSALFLRRL